MTFNDKLQAYLQLTRFDKPVGIELLLWPTLWGVMLAAMGQAQQQGSSAALPSLKMLVIFALGAIFMRAAGCAINDFADRKVDGHVTRTKGRPLADGRLSAKEAIATFLVLVLLSASLLFCFADSRILLVAWRSVIGIHLSIYEAFYPLAAGVFSSGFWLGDTDGICGDTRRA